MQAAQLSRFGAPDVLEIVELPMPSLGPGEVTVRIRAAGINFFETLVRRNRYAVTPHLPIVPGVEVAGVVEAVGEGVDPDLIGKRVAVPLFAVGRPAGGYAEYISVRASDVVVIPDGLPFEQAVALLVQGLTAALLVRQSAPQAKTVAVTAAAGGVGSLLIQVAKKANTKQVIALAGDPNKLEVAKSLGADFAFNYQSHSWIDQVKDATDGKGADIIYDTVGGPITGACLNALAPLGELVFAALNRCQLTARALETMFNQNQSIKGFALLPLLDAVTLRDELSRLFNLAQAGCLKVLIGGRYPLEQVAEAHRALEKRLTTGKVVLIP
ncbi:MAG: zinc-binding alcohol dehydrogenase family protein [Verrucomicrobia bacterium]|nr:zinc-binding alcohol dehydrogenase family protein [Verrucomicrobiota bacterium]